MQKFIARLEKLRSKTRACITQESVEKRDQGGPKDFIDVMETILHRSGVQSQSESSKSKDSFHNDMSESL